MSHAYRQLARFAQSAASWLSLLVAVMLLACSSKVPATPNADGGAGGSVIGSSGSNAAGAGASSIGGGAGAGGGGASGMGDSGGAAGTFGAAGSTAGSGGASGAGTKPPERTALQPLAVDGIYPRAILRSNGTIVASIVAQQASGKSGGSIFESTDDGLSFHIIGHIDEPHASDGLCCATLYELPKAIGALPAGALLWSASVGWLQTTDPMRLPIWSSVDGGKTWSLLATIIASAIYTLHHGVWEPEFSMLDDGTLVCHFSDETDPAHSQKLAAASTKDGVTWSPQKDTVSLTDAGLRPGMAIVRRGPSGVFFMSYEVCGVPGDNCTAHLRSSPDGWGWGDPKNIGLRPSTVDGKYFQHAPTLMWSSAPSQLGRFYLVGQVTMDASGNPAAENGNFILANANNGTQFWYGVPAAAPVSPAPYDNFCPNYSSPLVPLDNGTVALELASRWDGTVCRTYFARGPILGAGDATGIESAKTYRLVNVQSGQCLDVAGGSLTAHGRVEQWTCNGLAPQNWTLSKAVDGSFSLKAQNSGLCLTPVAESASAGTLVEQDTCDASDAQNWALHQVGLGYYELLHAGGVCLDNAGASTTPGTNIQTWTCNDLSPQIWHLEAR
ncbi:MAG TPA: RICIN domain-containing protein [Polyangiaceae bacterium]|nr:RICIN domain-containing protein [Polyangiaceae bacterium]